jgi:uncharacterized protein YbbC (DUF1343 family)
MTREFGSSYSRRDALTALASACALLAFAGPEPAAAQNLELGSGLPDADRPVLPALSNFELGDESFLRSDWKMLAGRRVGIITNQTGVLKSGESIISALLKNPKITVTALYSPEHGLYGNHGAGSTVQSSIDARSGKPVYSLYGKTRKPTPAMLADVDVLLFDIQDVGARTYTYISTLALIMQAAGQLGKAVWVLDRPNPIGGAIIEGPVLDPAFSSFIGLYPMPMRHGLTVGEVARLYQQSFGLSCDLHVVTMGGYTRTMLWPQTGLPWTPTSPNIRHFRTALVYLSTGPLGAAGVHNGVGSTLPFEVALGRRIDGAALAAELNARAIPGAHFLPHSLIPQTGYYAGKELSGVRIIVTDAAAFLAVRTGLEILVALHRTAPNFLNFSSGFDRDWGTDTVRRWTLGGSDVDEMERRWRPELAIFAAERSRALLYS